MSKRHLSTKQKQQTQNYLLHALVRSLARALRLWLIGQGSRESLNHSSVMVVTIGSPDPSLFPTRSMLRRSVASHLRSSGFSLSLSLSLFLSRQSTALRTRETLTRQSMKLSQIVVTRRNMEECTFTEHKCSYARHFLIGTRYFMRVLAMKY